MLATTNYKEVNIQELQGTKNVKYKSYEDQSSVKKSSIETI